MRDKVEQIREAGAELVVVGNGTPEHAADFRDQERIDYPLLVDPELEAYRTAGLRRGMRDALRAKTLTHAMRAFRQGFRQSSVKGDPWQLGGIFVIAPGGKVLWKYISREAGDHPDPDRILEVLRGKEASE